MTSADHQPVPSWQRLQTASSLLDVLLRDEEVTDVGELPAGHTATQWVTALTLPPGWEAVSLDEPATLGLAAAPARLAAYRLAESQTPIAVETLHLFAFTGAPGFRAILSNAARTFTDLGAADIHTEVLPIPVRRWSAAIRSTATMAITGQSVWSVQSNYLAGSGARYAGRLIVHSVSVIASHRDALTPDVAALCKQAYREFTAAVAADPHPPDLDF